MVVATSESLTAGLAQIFFVIKGILEYPYLRKPFSPPMTFAELQPKSLRLS